MKNIVRELNNEKVDIIRWSSNIRDFVTNALAPAKIKSFDMDEGRRRIKLVVGSDQLSQAIGKRGQNARLTSRLTGWQVDIEAEEAPVVALDDKFQAQFTEAVRVLAAIPGITAEQADALVHNGLASLEDLLQVEAADLAEIPQIGASAEAVLESARQEVARRTFKVGETSTV